MKVYRSKVQSGTQFPSWWAAIESDYAAKALDHLCITGKRQEGAFFVGVGLHCNFHADLRCLDRIRASAQRGEVG